MGRRRSSPVNKMFAWVRRQSMKVKTFLGFTTVLCSLLALKLLVRDYDHFFIASEAIHVAGIAVLIYKLITQKTCSGLLLLALYLHYYRRPKSAAASTKEYLHKRQLTRAPEPPGALPFIGHLHLMSGAVPVARILADIADKYGGIFSLRLGSHPALVVSSWEFAKECFTTHDTLFASRPLLTLGKYMGYNQAMFALAPYGPYWRYVRKIVTLELFTAWRLEKLKHIRESEVDMCIKDLNFLDENDGGRPSTIRVSMNKWFEHLTFNIISRTLAGKRFSAGDMQSADDCFKEAIKRALYLSGIFLVSDAIPSLEWMDFGGHIRAMKQTGKEIDVALSRWLEEHKRKTCS